MCRRKFEDEQTRPDYDRKANKKIRKPFRRFGSRRRVQREYRVYRYIYKGSRRPEVAGQLISHFFDEDSRNSRCSLCRDTSSNNNGELLRIAATTRTHCRESYIEERKRGQIKQECRPTFWSGERLPRFQASN